MKWLAILVLATVVLAGGSLRHHWLRPLVLHLAQSTGDSHALDQPLPNPRLAMPIKTGSDNLSLSATSSQAVDVDSGTVLFDHNSAEKRPIASITKLMTALVILKTHSLDETVTVPNLPSYQPGDVILGVTPGQKFRLGELLRAALIPSDNDAADVLAISDSGSVAAFSDKMNRLKDEWGISDAHFASANGLVDTNNYATAGALVKLGKLALVNADFKATVDTASTTIHDLSGRSYTLATTNQLLADARFDGIKTGYTVAAGESVLALATINGHRVITVVLNSPDRFGETTTLVNFLERNFKWQ